MNTLAAFVYWVIVAIWVTIFLTVIGYYQANRRIFGTTRLLLFVLALDAARNTVENTYFGLYFGAKFGFLAPKFASILGEPGLLILPKIGNVGAGCVVLGLLLWRWLPAEIHEREQTERHAAQLRELATIDGMTGLHNRREFMELAEAEGERCRRYDRVLSVVMIDIDHFKSINDGFGHDVGDQVIVLVAKFCRDAKLISDIAGRLGGEEFAILLPETSLVDAHAFAERLRVLIATESTSITNFRVAATVSIGVSSLPAAAHSVAECMRQADSALYDAKRSGRNRVCCFAAPKDEVAESGLKPRPG
jgi:diguanylate cyclase (GGDEF)-like protein